MKRRMFSLSMLVVTFAVLSSAGWAQQDPFIGTWKQNMAKSKYDPASLTPKTGTTVKREAAGSNSYKVTTDGMNPQGAATHTEYTATLDEKDCPLKGSPDCIKWFLVCLNNSLLDRQTLPNTHRVDRPVRPPRRESLSQVPPFARPLEATLASVKLLPVRNAVASTACVQLPNLGLR